jgi:hypothetical protein
MGSESRAGSVTFAGVVILIAATLNIIWGISALSDKEYFEETSLLFESLQTWGWFYIVVGSIQVLVGLLVLAGSGWGYALGMFGAFLAILVNFTSVGAYPIWSVMLIALNFFILWALAVNMGD